MCLTSDSFSLGFHNHSRRMGDYTLIHCNIIGKALGSVGRTLYHVTNLHGTQLMPWVTFPPWVHHIVCYMAEYLTIYN